MAVELLIQATTHSKAEKGWIEAIRSDAELAIHPWGGKEGPPNYVRIRITDLDVADVEQYLGEWKNEITWTKVRDVAGGRERYRLTVPNNTVTRNSQKGINNDIDTYLKQNYAGTRVSRALDQSEAEYDLMIPNLQEMQDDIMDLFEEAIVRRRYKIAELDVDAAVAVGGELTVVSAGGLLTRVMDGQA